MVSSAVVRAYDLGGFGDIAGAMRVASHLQRTGIDTRIRAKSDTALEKLQILGPDVRVGLEDGKEKSGESLQIDVAGHYRDERNQLKTDVPHNFTEDMDNPFSRRKLVPIYMKTGLIKWVPEIPAQFGVPGGNPMFYRPFREWVLPNPGERNVRKQILEAMKRGNRAAGVRGITRFFSFRKGLERVLDETERIGFAHLSPSIQEILPEMILEHPYFYSVHAAKLNYGHTFGIGMFSNSTLERRLTAAALQKYWNVVGSNGKVLKYNPDLPTLFFLGQQPQTTTTGLFLSSDIPNLVTGDLSLSDALYGLIAMEGQGFFYETPYWKMPTHFEINNILARSCPGLDGVYFAGSNSLSRFKFPHNAEEIREAFNKALEILPQIFGDEETTRKYTEGMRRALRTEIMRRFGDVPVEAVGKDGFYIPPGAPYLIQDATAQVVKTLKDDPDAFAEVDGIRKMLQDGVPVIVNVQTGVLEPAPQKPASAPTKNENFMPFQDNPEDSLWHMYKGILMKENNPYEIYKDMKHILTEEIYKKPTKKADYCGLDLKEETSYLVNFYSNKYA